MKKLVIFVISYLFLLSSALAAPETGQRVLTDNYEKTSPNIGNRHMQSVSTGKTTFFHPGVDFKGYTGSLVIAPLDGEVMGVQEKRIKANSEAYFNISARIKHAGGLETDYQHLDEVFVRGGDKVKRGTVIGTKGTTGYRNNMSDKRPPGYPHLHFEVYKDGQIKDPIPFMVGCFNPKREYKPLEFVYPGGCSYKK
jgi:murein DD-endopeptidase MepM/ murein hydrolase activator NlpD